VPQSKKNLQRAIWKRCGFVFCKPRIAIKQLIHEADLGNGSRKTDLGKTDLGKTDLGKTDLGKTDLGKTDLGKTDLGKTDLGNGSRKRI
jgi:uncharacterized protein YjbI with pentapeptide repeats